MFFRLLAFFFFSLTSLLFTSTLNNFVGQMKCQQCPPPVDATSSASKPETLLRKGWNFLTKLALQFAGFLYFAVTTVLFFHLYPMAQPSHSYCLLFTLLVPNRGKV